MTEKQVDLNQHHIRGLRRVLAASDVIAGDVGEQLPAENEATTLELEDKHIEVVAHLLEAYQNIYLEDLPEGEEHRADLGVVRDVENAITE